jgi:acyl-CoA synthetase (NDP forming)
MMSADNTNLDCIFNPDSICIVGASSREGSFGRLFLEGFIRLGFEKIYPVHPREKELFGLPAYSSINDIPHKVDLAILLVPQGEVLKIVRECAEKQVKGIVLFTAGFGETGDEGKKIEQELARIARSGGARLIGPNTNGLYCPSARLLTLPGNLFAGVQPLETGNVSLFAQSGSFNDYLTQVLYRKNIRFNKVVSNGNEADLGAADYLEYFGKDSSTEIIAGYLEGIKDGRRFYDAARNITPQKPVIIWKGGLTERGAKAALAHTGSLAGSRQVWGAMFKQAGIIQANSFEEVADCILAFSWLPLPQGRRVAILSGMGGTNVGTADNCISLGLELATFSDLTNQRLGKLIPSVGTAAHNPIDVGVGSLLTPDIFGQSLKIIAEDAKTDMIICITAADAPKCIYSVIEAAKAITKPLFVCLFDMPGLVEPYVKLLLDRHIPVVSEPKRAAIAYSKMCEYVDYKAGYM